MKTKRQNHHRGWKQALSVLLVFALAAGLVLGVPALSGVAYAAPILQDGEDGDAPGGNTTAVPGRVDLSKGNAITLNFQKDESGAYTIGLEPEETLVDLYRVAPAVPLSGYNVYAYCIDDSMPYYGAVKEFIDGIENWHKEGPLKQAPEGYPAHAGAENWLLFYYAPQDHTVEPDVYEQEGLAERLAAQYFGKDSTMKLADKPVEHAADVSYLAPYRTTIGTPAGGLPAGLYMSVVHGDMERSDYVVLQPQTDAKDTAGAEEGAADETAGTGGSAKVCTIAYSNEKMYTFQPQLISVPGRQTAGGATFDTTQEGDWQYAVQAFVKASSTDRFADLLIEKQLTNTVSNGSAMFVFRVRAYKPGEENGGKPVYETVVTLREGKMTSDVITGKIPAGSTVVITEEYSGLGYRFDQAHVSASWNDPGQTGGPAVTGTPAENGITITNIPAGRLHLTAPAGEEKILQDGAIETVTVTNAPDTTTSGGGSVVNSFTPGENNGWTWTQSSYDAETGKWNVTNTDTTGTTPAAPAEGEG